MIKKITQAFTFIALIVLATYAYNFYQNNRQTNRPDHDEINQALDKSIAWLQSNRNEIEGTQNPALWWMLKESSDIAGKPELSEIYRSYKNNYLDKSPDNIWTPFLKRYYKPNIPDMAVLQKLYDYQVFFAYALSCDDDLGSEPVIQKQLDSDFCTFHYIHPRCVTHQQMAVRLMLERDCGDKETLSRLSEALTDIIRSELVWDFRVGDAYLQRALLLAESGKIDEIKPVWIKRIIDAQNPDGGWDDIHPIIRIGDSALGYSSLYLVFRETKSDFHATAQGIWLMSLLLNQHKTTAPTISNDQ